MPPSMNRQTSHPSLKTEPQALGQLGLPLSPPQKNQWPLVLRSILSIAILFHFSVIALSYLSNNSLQRSKLADSLLQWIQPYSIPMGWYVELAPLPLVTDAEYERPVVIEYRATPKEVQWTTLIDSSVADARWKRLVTLTGALQEHDDSDGMSLIAHSIVAKAASSGIVMDRIRFATHKDSGAETIVFEAKIIRLSEDDVTLVPRFEPTRSVPVLPSQPKPVSGNATSEFHDAR